MPTYMPNPKNRISITHSATTTNYDNFFKQVKIEWPENGIAHATLSFMDDKSSFYPNSITSGDTLTVNVKDNSDTSYTEIFDGKIYMAKPYLNPSGEIVKLQADGNGWGTKNCLCKDDYGANSLNHPTLDTLAEIIEDNSYGLIDYWTNGGGSGYSYTTQVETGITNVINHILFPCKPVHKCIQDTCDLVTALKAGSAGPHWIFDVSDRLCVATIGNHATPASTYWPTWLEGTTNNTLAQGVDFSVFDFEKLDLEANYILYHSPLIKPIYDAWTESAASWGVEGTATVTTCAANTSLLTVNAAAGQPNVTVADASGFAVADIIEIYDTNGFEYQQISSILGNVITCAGNLVNAYTVANGGTVKRDHCKTGSYSIKGVLGITTAGTFYYPSTYNLSLNTTNIGGQYNVPTLTFYIRRNTNVNNNYMPDCPFIELGTGDPANNNYYYYSLKDDVTTAGKWTRVTLPIGTHANKASEGEITWHVDGSPSWNDIDYIAFAFTSSGAGNAHLYVDDLRINGYVLRGAKNSTSITNNKFRQIVITDNEGKDDSCTASDATGTIAQYAYAELLRRQTTPRVGMLRTKMIKTAMPGQKVHVHAKKTSSGTFNIDADFRVSKLIFEIGDDGYNSTFEVTDDLTNSTARTRMEDWKLIMSQARPEFQTRQATSIKMMDVDITQAVLEKDYPS